MESGGGGGGGGGVVLLVDMSHFLEFLRVMLLIAFHIEDVSELSLTKRLIFFFFFSLFN